jgi:hypothetical protein
MIAVILFICSWIVITRNYNFVSKKRLIPLQKAYDSQAFDYYEQHEIRHTENCFKMYPEMLEYYHSIVSEYDLDNADDWVACWDRMVERFPNKTRSLEHWLDLIDQETVFERVLNLRSLEMKNIQKVLKFTRHTLRSLF